ncbi:MAG: hypothetical protein AAF560_16395 [Acidobacteriota bacterium]
MQHLTVRNIPPDLASALNTEKQRRQTSLNQTVIDLLKQSLGVTPGQKRTNGLGRLAGRWTEEEFQEFEAATAPTREVDEELWR